MLSKHVAKLVEAKYLSTHADKKDSRRQWVYLTERGHLAYQGHIAALRSLTAQLP